MQVHEHSTIDTFAARGGQVIETVKGLIHEGNVRRVSIKQDGRTVAEFPLTFGVVGAALAPALAGIGAVVALLTDCTIEVERVTPPDGVGAKTTSTGVSNSSAE